MKQFAKHGMVLVAVMGVLLGTGAYFHRDGLHPNTSVDTMLLLIPDSANMEDPLIREWLDAADEEGFHLEVVRDSKLLDPMFQFHAAGLIVPDQVHRIANEALIGTLHDYVDRGGKLMLVYDACTLDLNGFFPRLESRLSDLVGVNYALYDKYKKNTTEAGQIWGNQKAMEELELPPGRYVPLTTESEKPGWLQRVSWYGTEDKENNQKKFTLVRYLYNDLKYSFFRTAGEFDGKVLLDSKAGLIAGYRKHGRGSVLFVNLPLGYLKSRTDGLLLHAFLRYFAGHILRLPYLTSVPDGTGGLVFNWHIDAMSSLKPIAVLDKAGIFDQGPFSIHFTAGPDVDKFGDGKGLNIEHNSEAQKWIRYFLRRGDVVGTHGGWIHNYFGMHLAENNQSDFERYIMMNTQAMEHASGQRMTEYSAPVGNHPEWVTSYLEQRGFLAYYFSGDSGMGPTRVYRDRGRDGSSIWGFPILHLGTEASLEEMNFDSVPQPLVQNWMLSLEDYTANKRLARLFYSHPLGATAYVHVLQKWLQHAQELSGEGRFRWYTMTDLANFLNSRRQVKWSLTRSGSKLLLEASHPKNLVHESWIFPKSEYLGLRVVQGRASVKDEGDIWLVTAKDGKYFEIEMEEHIAHPKNGL